MFFFLLGNDRHGNEGRYVSIILIYKNIIEPFAYEIQPKIYSFSRYGRGGNDYDYGNDYDTESSSRAPKSRFRSRFVRSHQQEDSDNEQSRGVRFNEKEKEKERERVLDTEFVSRGGKFSSSLLIDNNLLINLFINLFKL